MDFNNFIKELYKLDLVNKELNRLYNNDPDYSRIDSKREDDKAGVNARFFDAINER